MRRAPIVIIATIAGMGGVLAFRTSPSTSGILPSAGSSPVAGGTAGASAPASGGSSGGSSGGGSGGGSSGTSGGVRTATGPLVNYDWGVLSVKVTVSGKKITNVTIGSINDGGNPRSQYIDQQSIPLLEQQARQAQSANIQGVSGASYTSAGFRQSLQGALQSLGI